MTKRRSFETRNFRIFLSSILSSPGADLNASCKGRLAAWETPRVLVPAIGRHRATARRALLAPARAVAHAVKRRQAKHLAPLQGWWFLNLSNLCNRHVFGKP